jgi:hypothetical protein
MTGFRVASVPDLSAAQREAMFDILQKNFDGVTLEQFNQDLMEKDLALLVEEDNRLMGFSTMVAYSTAFQGEPINVIYSGDTIVNPEAWGSTALPRAWVAGVRRLQATLPLGRCYWLLLSSGFRTYRFMSVFWRHFYPCHDKSPDTATHELLVQLAHRRFGDQFDRERGVVRFRHPQRLRDGLKEIPTGRERDPHTEFFLKRNPGYLQGDELVCLTEICPENLTRAGRRMMPTDELVSHHR